MLDFYADWCASCIEMERETFTDAFVQSRLKGVVLLQADVTLNSADDRALMQRFGLFGPPGILFFSPQGGEQAQARVKMIEKLRPPEAMFDEFAAPFRFQQPPRKGDHGGNRPFAARSNVQAHHRALRKPDQRHRLIRQTFVGQACVQKRIQITGRGRKALCRRLGG
jgi:hypothetical protein